MAGFFTLLKTGFTTDHYYKSMNEALRRLDEEYTMLHYPYYQEEGESFHRAQKNLTDYCLSRIPSIEGKKVLEIGCGNGTQAHYILKTYAPSHMKAVDLNAANIAIARSESEKLESGSIEFLIGDAQNLSDIEDQSVDTVINIESAFHYPDKQAFLHEVSRVLKPGGHFLIADILTSRSRLKAPRKFWNKKMRFSHWERESYDTGLSNARLQVDSVEDISENVIRGFKMYPYWMKTMKKGTYFGDKALKLFYVINARINIRSLRGTQQYVVFAGRAA